MNKELCFILENKNVYLDHILVDYEYVPIFLLCKDDECQYYLALCTNINQYPINHINDQDLPEKDVKFKILQKHIKEYVQKFDKEFFALEQYNKEEWWREILQTLSTDI